VRFEAGRWFDGLLRWKHNDYLLYEDALEAKDGVDAVSWFLGDWFIRKAMWSSQASIKENAASLKNERQ
jgi:hypothetical protein